MEYGHRLVLTGMQAKRKFAGTVFIAEGRAAEGDEVRVPDEQAAGIKGRQGGGRNRKPPVSLYYPFICCMIYSE